MFGLKFLFAVFALSIVIFHALNNKHLVYAGILFAAGLFSAVHVLNLGGKLILPSILVMLLGMLSIGFVNTYLEDMKERGNAAFIKKKQALDSLLDENKDLYLKRSIIDEKAFVVGQIYEAMKTMSGMLKTEEIVRVFSSFINDRFRFSNCYLMVFDVESEKEVIKKDYKIVKGSPAPEEYHIETLEEWKKKVIEFVKAKKYSETLDVGYDLKLQLKIDKSVERLDILPLTVENKMVAVICIEGLSQEESKIFFILAAQFAMELKRTSLYEDVERHSFMDGLTEIYLRRYFLERMVEEIKRAERLKLSFAVVMLDLDRFKRTNDTFGHMVGDVVLKEVAAIIKANIREIDLVARYGGEEFVVLLPYANKSTAFQVAERIRKAVETKEINAYDEQVNVTISAGISSYPDQGTDLNEIINKSDKALYVSKQNGRNKTTVYSS